MYISIDIGGTKTRVALKSKIDKKNLIDFEKFHIFNTPKNMKSLKQHIKETVFDNFQIAEKDISAVVIGIAGMIDRQEQKVLFAPNVPYLNNKKAKDIVPFKSLNQDKVFVENDASLAGLAEAVVGVAKDYNVVAYITISTGVGGDRIIDKKIDDSRYNYEPGHHIIDREGPTDEKTGIHGSFEAFSSGNAFRNIYQISPQDCTDDLIWESYAEDLSIGLYNVIMMWQPEVIVIGGGLSQKSDYFIQHLKEYLDNMVWFNRPIPDIKVSHFDNKNVLIGGFVYLSQK